jgi:hypothetical protein
MFKRALRLIVVLFAMAPAIARGELVSFDLPDSIECRDVTPETFAVAHPALKVIEAKFRISARMSDDPSEIVDFEYVITSDDKTLRFQDYLPNTTLESAVADDRIEISDSSEKAQAAGADAHVTYKIFSIGATANQSSKKSECSHYKQVASKELVLASGTINREHGVFFKLRPSRAASLEGAKEFTFLATVPRSWRADLCTIACVARGKKKSTFHSTTIAPSGAEQSQIAMYLSGDSEAAALAAQLGPAQEASALASARAAKVNVFDTISGQTVGLITGKNSAAQARRDAAQAGKALDEVRQRLTELAR